MIQFKSTTSKDTRKPGIGTKNPYDKYTPLYRLVIDPVYDYDVVRSNNDGALLMRKACLDKTDGGRGNIQEMSRFANELNLVRSFDHPNVVYYGDGFLNKKGHSSEASGALYTPLYKYGTLRHLRYRVLLMNNLVPEVFIWHVLYEMTNALAYLHYGWSSVDEMRKENYLPNPTHRPILHNNLQIGDLWLKESLPSDPKTRPNFVPYPRIVLCNFGNSVRYPRWDKLESLSNELTFEDRQEWKFKQASEIKSLLQTVLWLCAGRRAECTLQNPWGTYITMPTGYSDQLGQLLFHGLVGVPGVTPLLQNVADLDKMILRSLSLPSMQIIPLPVNILSELDIIPSLVREGTVTEQLQQKTYLIDDRDSVLGPRPIVHDLLIRQDCDHRDSRGLPVPFRSHDPHSHWMESLVRLRKHQVNELRMAGRLGSECPLCEEVWYNNGSSSDQAHQNDDGEASAVVMLPCRGNHIFELQCLKALVEQTGQDTCPICNDYVSPCRGWAVAPIDLSK